MRLPRLQPICPRNGLSRGRGHIIGHHWLKLATERGHFPRDHGRGRALPQGHLGPGPGPSSERRMNLAVFRVSDGEGSLLIIINSRARAPGGSRREGSGASRLDRGVAFPRPHFKLIFRLRDGSLIRCWIRNSLCFDVRSIVFIVVNLKD